MKKSLEPTDMSFCRRRLGISWTEQMSNDEVLSKTEIKDTFNYKQKFQWHMSIGCLENWTQTGYIEE